ncbi:MAG: molybdate ABC transporter substrate-binding protein [bacterium]
MKSTRVFGGIAAWVVLSAAGASGAATLRVSAASSLTEAFGTIAEMFEASHPGTEVELNFGGSQILRTQIEQGAPVDVFAAADLAQMEPLEKAALVGAPRVFAHNELVAVASTKSGKVKGLGELARPGIRIVVAGETVPVGRYTMQLLAKMNAAGLWGDDFQARFGANVVSRETNVRAVLAKVSLGEADAGIVYRTDVAAAEGVTVLDIPSRWNVIATYPIAVVSRTESPDLAEELVELVTGADGQAILRRHGFLE